MYEYPVLEEPSLL